jgi:hypothetical protein
MKHSTNGGKPVAGAHVGKPSASSGSPAHRGESVGPGPAGSVQYESRGPGKSMETRENMNESMYPSAKTPSGKGKVPNHTRGDEEDGN